MTSYAYLAEQICDQGYVVLDSFLPNQQWQGLREKALLWYNNKHFQHATIGKKQFNNAIRRDSICWLNEQQDAEIDLFFSTLHRLRESLNQQLLLKMVEIESHLAYYQVGSFYQKHVDQFQHKKSRVLSFVYYLNEHWNESFGGNLQIYQEDDSILTSVQPCGNRFICFRSDLPHAVQETKKSRWSIAGWMKTTENFNE